MESSGDGTNGPSLLPWNEGKLLLTVADSGAWLLGLNLIYPGSQVFGIINDTASGGARMIKKRIRPKQETICKLCGKSFMARTDKLKMGCVKFCSRRCTAIFGRRTQLNQRKYKMLTKKDKATYKEVRKALNNGIIKRMPCQECGQADTDAHHEDYSKPLDITWLCRSHHNKRHIQISLQYSQGPCH